MAATGFRTALLRFALEAEENKTAVLALWTTAIQQALETPDGNLTTQVTGSMNGKYFQFQVDRKLTDLIADLDYVKAQLVGDHVPGVHIDFSQIAH